MTHGEKRIAILGGGRLARAISVLLHRGGVEVRIWEQTAGLRQELQQALPFVSIMASVEEAVANTNVVFFAVPGAAIPDVADAYGPYASGDHLVLHATRGVAEGFVLPHEAILARTCVRQIGVLGGPLYFRDLAEKRPLFAVIASRYDMAIRRVRTLCEGTQLRLHPTHDIVGVEVTGALSHVAAIAGGMADALGLGDTARGILLARGLIEAGILGQKLGADASTFTGLAGIGDLIPRRVSATERHTALGQALVQGKTLDAALADISGAVEGILTARAARAKALSLGVTLPLVQTVAELLDGASDAARRIDALLDLDLAFSGDARAL